MVETISKIYNWLETSGAKFGDTSKITLSCSLVTEEYEEFCKANAEDDEKEVIDSCIDIVWVFSNNLFFRGISLERVEEMFKKVEESNFSKFCLDESTAIRTVEAYTNGEHWDKMGTKIETYYEKVGNYYVIKRLSDSKVLKSLSYIKV